MDAGCGPCLVCSVRNFNLVEECVSSDIEEKISCMDGHMLMGGA